jgi:tetratricopeptide (TPR) repeat protein
MSNNKTKLLLILSLILVSLLSNKISNPLFDFEGRGSINHDTALAFTYSDPSRNNIDIQSTTSPIYQTNNSSSDVSALVNKGDALYKQGNYTQAIQYYDKVLAIDPKDGEALNGIGDALRGQGNYTQAIQYYDKALAVNAEDTYALTGKGDALNGQGDALHYQGNYTQAIQYYDNALAINPKDIYALGAIGKVFADQSNYTKAIQYYNKALAINSTDPGALFDKQNAISEIVQSGHTSGYNRGCIDKQIPTPSERYINQSKNEPNFHSKAFMQVYNEGFNACSSNLPKLGETLKMFNILSLKVMLLTKQQIPEYVQQSQKGADKPSVKT